MCRAVDRQSEIGTDHGWLVLFYKLINEFVLDNLVILDVGILKSELRHYMVSEAVETTKLSGERRRNHAEV